MLISLYQPPGLPAAYVSVGDGVDLIAESRRVIPAGLPFWVVDDSTLPEDRTFRNAWGIDGSSMGEPSGIGGEA